MDLALSQFKVLPAPEEPCPRAGGVPMTWAHEVITWRLAFPREKILCVPSAIADQSAILVLTAREQLANFDDDERDVVGE
jgi:hypothetical protein